MIDGYVINNLGRSKHIFKMNVTPGKRISLEALYDMYGTKYGGEFDADFLVWLEKTKVPPGSGFDIVVKSIDDVPEKVSAKKEKVVEVVEPPSAPIKFSGGKLTARQIADLKIKDDPKKLIKEVQSIHKLRRALSLCKGRPGKEIITKLIHGRLSELS